MKTGKEIIERLTPIIATLKTIAREHDLTFSEVVDLYRVEMNNTSGITQLMQSIAPTLSDHQIPKVNISEIASQYADYGPTGLRYDIDHLNSLNPTEFIFRTLDDQADYHDVVTHHYINDKDFCMSIMPESLKPSVSNINVTTIGNLAYLIIKSPHFEVVQRARLMLDKIEDLLKY